MALDIDDSYVVEALRYIWENATRGILVSDVVKHVGLSRRVLEVRFQRETGHSMHARILRVRLERVKAFLQETDLPMRDIAAKCGFGSENYLGKVFRKEFGMTLRQFRHR